MKPQEQIKYKLVDVEPAKAVIVNSQRADEPIEIGLFNLDIPHENSPPMKPKFPALFVLSSVNWHHPICFLSDRVAGTKLDRIAKREVERRQAALPRGAEALARGQGGDAGKELSPRAR